MKPVTLSERMRAVAEMVTVGNRVCDVGCDHGFVSIYLVEQGISPGALAMDVRTGPLSAAREHVAERGLERKIETRLSNGLHNYNIGEAETLICAGMGGSLMRQILSDHPDKTRSFVEMVLQPQSELEQFRAWLREAGYRIAGENMIEEEGKFYPMMRVVHRDDADMDGGGMPLSGETVECGLCKLDVQTAKTDDLQIEDAVMPDISELCKLQDRYGPVLLARKDKVLTAYLQREKRIYGGILEELSGNGLWDGQRRRRYEQIQRLLDDCCTALKMMEQ